MVNTSAELSEGDQCEELEYFCIAGINILIADHPLVQHRNGTSPACIKRNAKCGKHQYANRRIATEETDNSLFWNISLKERGKDNTLKEIGAGCLYVPVQILTPASRYNSRASDCPGN